MYLHQFNLFSPHLHLCKYFQVFRSTNINVIYVSFLLNWSNQFSTMLLSWAELGTKLEMTWTTFQDWKATGKTYTESFEPWPLLSRPTVLLFMKLLVKLSRKFLHGCVSLPQPKPAQGVHPLYRDYSMHVDTFATTLRVPGCQHLVNLYKFRDQFHGFTLTF